MAIVQVSSAPSRAEYEQVLGLVGLDENRPAGLILQTAAEQADGQVQIVTVWESAEAATTFVESRLFPAFAKAGVMDQVMASPPPVPLEAFHFIH